MSLARILKEFWGFDDYRPLQKEAMEQVVSDRDSVVVLPTGGGKSLCFQAPALMKNGTAVVISPLISLMKDQVDALRTVGIEASFLNSSLGRTGFNAVEDDLRAGRVKILYIAPERLVKDDFLALLHNVPISFFAVDEAHCISMWGHDFRPEYRALRVLGKRFPHVGVHAYTATATDQVRRDIACELGLRDPAVLVGSFDRPNLVYKAVRRANRMEQIRSILDRHRSESCIVYCIRRKDVDQVAAALASNGYRALPYHAGMSDIDRKENQDAFVREDAEIIVATVAFGMGIDKSNVRCVIHAGAPKSLEHYQQETGRAGRDGLEAECRLLYSGGDFRIWRLFIDEMEPEPREIALRKLNEMYAYCTGLACRHRSLSAYFGQDLAQENCGACDVCLGDLNLAPEPMILGQKILSCVVRLRELYGAGYTVQVLCGSDQEIVKQRGHDTLSTFGLLKEERKRSVRDWIEQLVGQGYLERTGDYNVLRVTPAGWRVLRGEEAPCLLDAPEKKKPARVSRAAVESWQGVDRDLFEKLRRLRLEKAGELGVPAFIVFSDAALRDMARLRPLSLEEFLEVHGVGQKKCDDFGEAFVAAVTNHVERSREAGAGGSA